MTFFLFEMDLHPECKTKNKSFCEKSAGVGNTNPFRRLYLWRGYVPQNPLWTTSGG